MTDFSETTLRLAIDNFVDRCFDDVMIGYLFKRSSRDRVKQFEFEHTLDLIRGTHNYSGRSIRSAHENLQIFSGHFDRRLFLLGEALSAAGIPQEIRHRIVTAQEALRLEILPSLADCNE